MTAKLGMILLFLSTIVLTGCTRLPSDFESLSADKKVASYVIYLREGGVPGTQARRLIAGDGLPASDAIATELKIMDNDNDKAELIMILQQMQVRGTNLQGTRAELTLREMAAQHTSQAELRQLAEGTLAIIDRRTTARGMTSRSR